MHGRALSAAKQTNGHGAACAWMLPRMGTCRFMRTSLDLEWWSHICHLQRRAACPAVLWGPFKVLLQSSAVEQPRVGVKMQVLWHRESRRPFQFSSHPEGAYNLEMTFQISHFHSFTPSLAPMTVGLGTLLRSFLPPPRHSSAHVRSGVHLRVEQEKEP